MIHTECPIISLSQQVRYAELAFVVSTSDVKCNVNTYLAMEESFLTIRQMSNKFLGEIPSNKENIGGYFLGK